jgi:hypothetical protein
MQSFVAEFFNTLSASQRGIPSFSPRSGKKSSRTSKIPAKQESYGYEVARADELLSLNEALLCPAS